MSSSLNLHFSADSAEELLSAVRTFVAMSNLPVSAAQDAAPKRGPGRPPKNPESVAQDASPVTAAPAETPAAAPAAAAGASIVSKSDVQTVLIQVVQRVSKAACRELCLKYGAPNLSALDTAVYPALLADAKAALEKVAS